MSDYRRYCVPGGTYFLTVNLLERRSDLLVRQIDILREAVRRSDGSDCLPSMPGWCCPNREIGRQIEGVQRNGVMSSSSVVSRSWLAGEQSHCSRPLVWTRRLPVFRNCGDRVCMAAIFVQVGSRASQAIAAVLRSALTGACRAGNRGDSIRRLTAAAAQV